MITDYNLIRVKNFIICVTSLIVRFALRFFFLIKKKYREHFLEFNSIVTAIWVESRNNNGPGRGWKMRSSSPSRIVLFCPIPVPPCMTGKTFSPRHAGWDNSILLSLYFENNSFICFLLLCHDFLLLLFSYFFFPRDNVYSYLSIISGF